MDIQNYMSLFRACGRERNVRKALDLLRELEESDVGIDTTAYNCVLDVCLKSGDARQGTELFAKMKTLNFVDVISYNTLLKGARATGPLDAMSILQDMRARNLQPNQVTYNSLINACVSKGDMKTAWSFVEEMQQQSVEIDNFTCSIMMKGLKFSSSKDDVDKTLNLIERSRVRPDEARSRDGGGEGLRFRVGGACLWQGARVQSQTCGDPGFQEGGLGRSLP